MSSESPTMKTGEAVRQAGISFRQLDHWASHNICVPTVPGSGPGSRREWSHEDVVGLRDTGRVSNAIIGETATRAVLRKVNAAAKADPHSDSISVDLGTGVRLVIDRCVDP